MIGRRIETADELFALPPGTILTVCQPPRATMPTVLLVTGESWITGVPWVAVSGDERPIERDEAHYFLPAEVIYELDGVTVDQADTSGPGTAAGPRQ